MSVFTTKQNPSKECNLTLHVNIRRTCKTIMTGKSKIYFRFTGTLKITGTVHWQKQETVDLSVCQSVCLSTQD